MNNQENKNKENANSGDIPPKNFPISQRISANNSPIRQLLKTTEKDNIQTQIGKAIALVIADLGLKTIPNKLAQKRMVHYLLSYYQDFSFGEIIKAFELALVGKIKVNIEHYDSFDIKYLTKILNAYRGFRNAQNRQLNRSMQIQVHQLTEEEKRESRISFFCQLEKTYELYERTGLFKVLIPWLVYNIMLDYNVLRVSEERWNNYQEQAIEQYKNKLHNPRDLSQKKRFQSILVNFERVKFTYPFEISRIRDITKEIALKDFFKELKNNKLNFTEILKNSDAYE